MAAIHVNNTKISHCDKFVVDDVISKLKSIYGKTDPMLVTWGDLHQQYLLGMTIDFRKRGEVQITMYDYIQKMLNNLPENMKGS